MTWKFNRIPWSGLPFLVFNIETFTHQTADSRSLGEMHSAPNGA
jgi:hypothetical protein